ncbi:MAG: CPBP family intramembrane metalloprotease [Pyrobaculum arsenaticum]|uniref:Abortive infection protein n=2 Tax=Pyrobaculum arsenaticum TaxID=121277 RepID=A4WI05_PYRAR|nr:CPBP family intramembrane glutamic endopeptidase [Pyrobaculum arsenaticum]ABP50022.1 Abortive infection protein [Pyrobaculum arsenaticum DSM 13514]MCY0890211.1 CPBP family intramembrane metalloprotease [Pyrobaculum arsenaticum]NYR15010.1 CPBP family intramembrane metalloprotease [Pyrobaculum arsenaticum]
MILFLVAAFGLGWLFQLLAVYSPFWFAATMWTPGLGALLELKREGKLRPRPLGEEWPGLKTLYKATTPAAFWLALSILLAYLIVGPSPYAPPPATRILISGSLVEAPGWVVYATLLLSIIAPLINALFATFGEELGWRGYLLPRLAERIGWAWASAAVGVVWGVWHAPAILVVGHNYGRPWCLECLAVFVLLTVPVSFIHTWAYLKYGVWGAAFLHGAVNGWAGAYFLIYHHTFGDLAWSLTGLYGAATLAATAAVFWLLANPTARRSKLTMPGWGSDG